MTQTRLAGSTPETYGQHFYISFNLAINNKLASYQLKTGMSKSTPTDSAALIANQQFTTFCPNLKEWCSLYRGSILVKITPRDCEKTSTVRRLPLCTGLIPAKIILLGHEYVHYTEVSIIERYPLWEVLPYQQKICQRMLQHMCTFFLV
ncbi:unnamed protein product [Rotaria socialis]|uniref:Uncharacterized protein n=1 Tax=Rotaria socialis TaxID=392032 RepID=A0A817VQC9_9BILA|nr:unnamed protein product [Rotaria socialis]